MLLLNYGSVVVNFGELQTSKYSMDIGLKKKKKTVQMEVMFLLSFGEFVDFTPWNKKKRIKRQTQT